MVRTSQQTATSLPDQGRGPTLKPYTRRRPEAARPPLLLSCLPAAALFCYVVWARLGGPADLRPGSMAFALVCPLLAIALALLPSTGKWVSARKRFDALHAIA